MSSPPLLPSSSSTRHAYPHLNLHILSDDEEHANFNVSPTASTTASSNSHKKKQNNQTSPLIQPKPVSLFYYEKLSLFLHFFQIHALIWLAAYTYYPERWRVSWRFSLFFIIDIHNFIRDETGSIEGSNQLVHTIFILALYVLSLLLYRYIIRLYKNKSEVQQTMKLSYIKFQLYALLWGEFMYIPVCLLFFRVWSCSSLSSSLIYINRSFTCWEYQHIVLLVIIVALCLPGMLYFPYLMYQRINKLVIFHDNNTHERYLQSRELEYMMGLNTFYEYSSFFYITSYKRRFVYTRLIQLFQKFLLCLFLILLDPNRGNALTAQMILFLFIYVPYALYSLIGQYRLKSTNHMRMIYDAIIFITLILTIIQASSGTNSSNFMTPDTFSGFLLVINLVGLGVICLLFIRCLYRHKLFTKHVPFHENDWPSQPSDITALHHSFPILLNILNTSRELELEARESEETMSREKLRLAIQQIREILYDPSTKRSMNELQKKRIKLKFHSEKGLSRSELQELNDFMQLGNEKALCLAWTLQDIVEDLALLYNTLSRTGESEMDESARLQKINNAMIVLKESLHHKMEERNIMSAYKKSLFERLLILRDFLPADYLEEDHAFADPVFIPLQTQVDKEKLTNDVRIQIRNMEQNQQI